MKFPKVKLTKPAIASILVVALSGAITSAAIVSMRMAGEPSNNPWDYTIYAFRNNNSYNSTAEQLDIDGDIRSAGNMIFSGNNSFISGNVVAGGKIDNRLSEFNAGYEFENMEGLIVNPVFSNVYSIAVDSAEVIYESSIKRNNYTINDLIVGENNLQIDISENYGSDESDQETDYKFGAFGADFMASVYENSQEWSKVFPFLFNDETIDSKDFLDIGNNSAFIPVAEQSFSDEWENADKLPESPFQNNMSVNSIIEYIEKEKTDNPVFRICNSSESTIIQAASDNSTINPQEAEDKESIIVSGGNFALNGEYGSIEEIRFDNWGGAQLIGDYPNLKYIYMSSWSNLNLAGNFPSLECVYLTGGQLLLGNGDIGFSTENASIIAEHGTIIIYSAKDVTLDNCKIMTMENIVIRGSGKESEASEFKTDNTIFAACNAITFEDMHDENNERYVNIPIYYSAAPISIVNCNIDMLQGCFVSMNGAMVLTESDIPILRGFIFAPLGVNYNPLNSTAMTYINTYSYNIQSNINNLNKQQNGIWEKGTVHELESARFPLKLAENVMNISDFISDISKVKNDNGEYVDYYYIKGAQSNAGILTFNSSVFANDDITITAGIIKNDGQSMPIVSSKTGDIIITVDSEMDWKGIIFAPNGRVTIIGSGHLKCRVFAQEVIIISDKLIIEDIDENLSTLGFTKPDNEDVATTTKPHSENETTTTASTTTNNNISITKASSEKNVTSTTLTTSTVATTTTADKEHGDTLDYTQAEYEYDKLGRLIRVIYDEENYIEYSYDANGNITDIKKTVNGETE